MDWFISGVRNVNRRHAGTIAGEVVNNYFNKRVMARVKKTWIFRWRATRHQFNQKNNFASSQEFKIEEKGEVISGHTAQPFQDTLESLGLLKGGGGWPLSSDPSSHLITGQTLKIQIIYRASSGAPQAPEPASIPSQGKTQAAAWMPLNKSPPLVCDFVFYMHLCAFLCNAKKKIHKPTNLNAATFALLRPA